MAQNQTHHHPPQLSSNYALPIFAILIVFILITYFILVTKCCLKFHPLRWISILPPSQDEDPFIAFSPTIRNRGGVDESIIQKIPTFQFTKGEGDEYDHQSVKGCVVCLSSFQEQDMLKVLPNCSHYFHLDCINIWLQTNSNCPLCRTSISGNTQVPMEHIIAPSSSPQDSQLFSNMGSDEDFVVIELWGEGEHGGTTVPQIQQESRNDSTKMEEKKNVNLKQKKWKRVSCIMDDECIDVRRKDDQFCVETIRRSFSLDSANDRQVYLDVQDIVQHNHRSQNEDCDSSRGRRSFFPLCYGRGMRSKPALLAPQNRECIVYKKIPKGPIQNGEGCNGAKSMMKQSRRELLEFRTPQHPSLGTNNWGGASPLLARNIPEESLEQKYTKLNTTRTRDEIFPAETYDQNKHEHIVKRSFNRGIARVKNLVLFKFMFSEKEKRTTTLGSNSKKIKITWLPRFDPKNRWPQGWC